KDEYSRLLQQRDTITETLEQLNKVSDTVEDAEGLKRIAETREPYAASISRLYQLASHNREDEAMLLLLTETRTRQSAFFGAVEDYLQSQSRKMDELARQSQHDYVEASSSILRDCDCRKSSTAVTVAQDGRARCAITTRLC